ncbi:MAG: DUF1554 domain-containing protein, partial [Leptospira sp.]|nr:DUF1554 domain-containing protein [Leptospira sp.]
PRGIVTAGGSGQISISWQLSPNANSYNLYWKDTNGVTKTNATKIKNISSPYVHLGLQSSKSFYYIVTAENSSGESPPSGEVNARTFCNPCKVFMTNSYFVQTDFFGISGADSKCNSDPNIPTGATPYKAFIVDGTNRVACTTANCAGGNSEHIDWVIRPDTNYVRSDGATLIKKSDSNGIFNPFPLVNSVTSITSGYWSGMLSDWTTAVANHCNLWTDIGAANGMRGQEYATSVAFLQDIPVGCGALLKLMCVEQ